MTTDDQVMTVADLIALPPSVPLWPVAARAHGISKWTAYELAKRDQLPFPVIRFGRLYKVNRADLLRSLGINPDVAAVPA